MAGNFDLRDWFNPPQNPRSKLTLSVNSYINLISKPWGIALALPLVMCASSRYITPALDFALAYGSPCISIKILLLSHNLAFFWATSMFSVCSVLSFELQSYPSADMGLLMSLVGAPWSPLYAVLVLWSLFPAEIQVV